MKPWRLPRLASYAITFAVFQAAWFACVESAAHGVPAWGVAAVAAVVLAHVALAPRRVAELMLVAACLGVGFAWDGLMIQDQWIVYRSPGPLPSLAPAWILALWALFATTLSGPLRALQSRPAWSALLGAVGGPLSYLAAQRLGACALAPGSEPVLALGWGVLTPALLALARRLQSGPAR